jgi:hypothetical protein
MNADFDKDKAIANVEQLFGSTTSFHVKRRCTDHRFRPQNDPVRKINVLVLVKRRVAS